MVFALIRLLDYSLIPLFVYSWGGLVPRGVVG